uniref:Mismatch repair endonuclease PMS2 n=1 Tax=Crassostrea virginica TaxID=6565 RepID=A0A8B8CGL3_CRAVI|nr:mismatch repair endonuclease PMS2-like [Crassostrea virginica]
MEEDHVLLAKEIKAIDKKSVHRICSGQVVLTLATAVKELVENSIDAGATSVEIKLKDYGLESIEVGDDGVGVEESNFEGLTLKHHTSKLQDFTDLINVDTFGFRGEALSSLCALSSLTVTTKHKDASVGTKLEFDFNGKINTRSPHPRQRGTTVLLQNLFSTLPVRHKEFQRNIKKEFSRMIQVLTSYCIISTGVRITCSNQTKKGGRSTVVSSSGNKTLRENITDVFGPKQIQSLMEFKKFDPSDDVLDEFNLKVTEDAADCFRIEGYVSKCDHGLGRSTTDRQFIFINGRPCDSVKISKVINEIYHQYNRHQYPFVALHITMKKESVDVNVTPDKRQIFMENEKILLATIKTSLTKIYEPTVSSYPVALFTDKMFQSNLSSTNSASETKAETARTASQNLAGKLQISALSNLKRKFSSAFAKPESEGAVSPSRKDRSPASKQRRLDRFLHKSSPKKDKDDDGQQKSEEDVVFMIKEEGIPFPTGEQCVTDSITEKVGPDGDCARSDVKVIFHSPSDHSQRIETSIRDPRDLTAVDLDTQSVEKDYSGSGNRVPVCSIDSRSSISSSSEISDHESSSKKNSSNNNSLNHVCSKQNTQDTVKCSGSDQLCSNLISGNSSVQEWNSKVCSVDNSDVIVTKPVCLDRLDDQDSAGPNTSECSEQTTEDSPEESMPLTITSLDEKESHFKKERTVHFDFKKLKEQFETAPKKKTSSENISRKFRAVISPNENQSAEEELSREISKSMFKEMEILGQFNLGFIIVRLNRDLFIVDQHATDEKYNFEQLQQNTVIQCQKLIQPQNLELTASNEIILMDNLEVFRKNGFDFIVNEHALPMQRVKLTSIPVSRNWTFGKEDIEELIFMLSDSPNVMCRPSRVRQMFASRACRKSIMIGTALKKSEMKKLVCHMGEIEQPWNCPHGRPTMRHLINLDMVPK